MSIPHAEEVVEFPKLSPKKIMFPCMSGKTGAQGMTELNSFKIVGFLNSFFRMVFSGMCKF